MKQKNRRLSPRGSHGDADAKGTDARFIERRIRLLKPVKRYRNSRPGRSRSRSNYVALASFHRGDDFMNFFVKQFYRRATRLSRHRGTGRAPARIALKGFSPFRASRRRYRRWPGGVVGLPLDGKVGSLGREKKTRVLETIAYAIAY